MCCQSQNEILACTRCPRLTEYRERVAKQKVRRFQDWTYWGKPVPSFGAPDARLLVVGLAPAAHGGNRTGRMFTGDRSGDWLFRALHRFGFATQAQSTARNDGLKLIDCHISAAVHCAPPDNKPLPEEFANCRPYLDDELLRLTQVAAVVLLGRIAFTTYFASRRHAGLENPSPLPTFGHGHTASLAGGVRMVCSYHPSQQNTQTGRLTEAMFDDVFREARRALMTRAV
jgi:uracil-DNA glycosylase family 4